MAQGFAQNFKIKTSVVVFLKNSSTPIILYFDDPYKEYNELMELCKTQSPVAKLIEKETAGPIKKIAFLSNQIVGVAIQEEQILK